MRKTIGLLMALLMLLSAFASAQAGDITGKWYSSQMRSDNVTFTGKAFGMEVTLDFHSDGTCDLTSVQDGKTDASTVVWELDGNYGIIDKQYEFTYSGTRINLFIEGAEVILTRKRISDPPQDSIARAGILVEDKVYTGKAIKPKVSVVLDGVELEKGVDYSLTYRNNKSVGRATVIVKGKGALTGKAKGYFDIRPKSIRIKKLTAGKNSLIVRWSPRTGQTTGYIIEYATSKSFKNADTVAVHKASAGACTIGRLKSGKKYYVRIAAFKMSDGLVFRSDWSSSASVRVK